MRTSLVFAFVSLASFGLAAGPTAAGVIQRCQKAYDSVKTFQQEANAVVSGERVTASISFSRPGNLRVRGSAIFGLPYDLLSTPKETWVFSNRQWAKQESAEMGIACITGISANTGSMVPSALLHTSWASLTGFASSKTAVGEEKVGGRPAFRLKNSGPFPMTVWIDAKTYFIVRTQLDAPNTKIVVEYKPPVVNKPIPASRFKRG